MFFKLDIDISDEFTIIVYYDNEEISSLSFNWINMKMIQSLFVSLSNDLNKVCDRTFKSGNRTLRISQTQNVLIFVVHTNEIESSISVPITYQLPVDYKHIIDKLECFNTSSN